VSQKAQGNKYSSTILAPDKGVCCAINTQQAFFDLCEGQWRSLTMLAMQRIPHTTAAQLCMALVRT
jgi:hypothetical protein